MTNRRLFTGNSAETRWRFLYRRDIADLTDPTNVYLSRWKLVETPWFGIFVHCIRRPDADRVLHDHPWNVFRSLILSGGYVEEHAENLEEAVYFARYGYGLESLKRPDRLGRYRYWKPGSFHAMRNGEFHRIRKFLVPCRPVWTLVLVGRRAENWGYATTEGFVDHDEFHARYWRPSE